MKQKELSRWLRVVVVIGWIACLLLSVWIMPALARESAEGIPELAYLEWPCLAVFWLGMVPVILALWFGWKIFVEIGRDNSFCRDNARRLHIISALALADTLLCLLSMIILILLNALHPGIFLLMLFIAVAGAGVTAAAAVLSHLTLKAVNLQDENELTI